MDAPDKAKYPSYSGLGRTAMIWGIPLMPLLVVCCVTALGMLVAVMILKPAGLLVPIISVPVILFMKKISATDDQALRILWLEVYCLFQRRNTHIWGKAMTLAPMRYGRNRDSYKRFE